MSKRIEPRLLVLSSEQRERVKRHRGLGAEVAAAEAEVKRAEEVVFKSTSSGWPTNRPAKAAAEVEAMRWRIRVAEMAGCGDAWHNPEDPITWSYGKMTRHSIPTMRGLIAEKEAELANAVASLQRSIDGSDEVAALTRAKARLAAARRATEEPCDAVLLAELQEAVARGEVV